MSHKNNLLDSKFYNQKYKMFNKLIFNRRNLQNKKKMKKTKKSLKMKNKKY